MRTTFKVVLAANMKSFWVVKYPVISFSTTCFVFLGNFLIDHSLHYGKTALGHPKQNPHIIGNLWIIVNTDLRAHYWDHSLRNWSLNNYGTVRSLCSQFKHEIWKLDIMLALMNQRWMKLKMYSHYQWKNITGSFDIVSLFCVGVKRVSLSFPWLLGLQQGFGYPQNMKVKCWKSGALTWKRN